jgi:ferrous iron transport protein A
MIRSVASAPANPATALGGVSSSSLQPLTRLDASTGPLTLERLAALGATDVATIEGVEGEPQLRRRLLEAGFTTGCRVTFVMSTPFGDPLVFFVRGASIALRKSEARCVRVRI